MREISLWQFVRENIHKPQETGAAKTEFRCPLLDEKKKDEVEAGKHPERFISKPTNFDWYFTEFTIKKKRWPDWPGSNI